MLNRRDFIKGSLTSSLALLTAQYPETLAAQDTSDYEGILFNGRVSGGTSEFFFLRNVSWQFISTRGLFGGPFEYESQPFWSNGARTAWDSAFSPFLGRDGRDMLFGDQSAAFEAMTADRADFTETEFGRSLAAALLETYSGQQDDFIAWCSEIGISPEGRLFNSIISAQALFAVQFATYNETTMVNAGGRSFFDRFTWVWPFCGG
jgi:hypothetical protein